MKKKPIIFEINPNSLYVPEKIVAIIGDYGMRILRNYGLKTFAGYYPGMFVLESLRAYWQDTSRQRATGKGGILNEKVAENIKDTELRVVPKHEGPISLRNQLEDFKRQV